MEKWDKSSDWTALPGAVIGSALGNLLGVIISTWYTVHGAFNAMGWSAVLLYALFFLGFAYYATIGQAVTRRASV